MNIFKLSIIAIFLTILFLFINLQYVYPQTTFVVRVTDVDGEPLEGALVTLVVPPPGAFVLANGTTDEEGYIRFSLDSPPNEVTIFVSWRKVVVFKGRASPTQGSLEVRANVGDIRINVLSTSQDPIEGLIVELSWLGIDGVKTVTSTTDVNGLHVFSRMPLIKYNLSIYTRNGDRLYQDVIDTYIDRDLTILLEIYSLSLNILDAQGNPLPGVSVKLTGEGVSKKGITDSNGTLNFEYLRKGTYVMEIEYFGYYENRTIVINSDKTINIILKNISKKILRVIVSYDNNTYISFANVEIISEDGATYIRGFTDVSGVYVASLYPGNYLVSVTYKGQSKTVDVRLDGDKDVKIIFNSAGSTNQLDETPSSFLDYISGNIMLIIFLIAFTVFLVIVIFHYIYISRHI